MNQDIATSSINENVKLKWETDLLFRNIKQLSKAAKTHARVWNKSLATTFIVKLAAAVKKRMNFKQKFQVGYHSIHFFCSLFSYQSLKSHLTATFVFIISEEASQKRSILQTKKSSKFWCIIEFFIVMYLLYSLSRSLVVLKNRLCIAESQNTPTGQRTNFLPDQNTLAVKKHFFFLFSLIYEHGQKNMEKPKIKLWRK